nr:MAG TPA: hypothetical protein [Caudoviricetes sp.]
MHKTQVGRNKDTRRVQAPRARITQAAARV